MLEEPPALDDRALAAEVRALLDEGRNIDAVKRLKDGTGWTLRQAFLWINREWAARVEPARKPCPSCGRPLRTDEAKQCFSCGADWH